MFNYWLISRAFFQFIEITKVAHRSTQIQYQYWRENGLNSFVFVKREKFENWVHILWIWLKMSIFKHCERLAHRETIQQFNTSLSADSVSI